MCSGRSVLLPGITRRHRERWLVSLAHEAWVFQRRQRRIVFGDEERILWVARKERSDALRARTERLGGVMARRTGAAVAVEGLVVEELLAELDQGIRRARWRRQREEKT